MTEHDGDIPDPGDVGAFNRSIVDEFRANNGHVPRVPGGAGLLLHTTGAKSGEPRLTPLAYLGVENGWVVAGSWLGSDRDPAWVHNLRANERARVEVGTDQHDVIARELPPGERDALFATFAQRAPVLARHQQHTDRVIPLFELRRTTP
ncbi:nitroreductase family deazaflavin-dependent oxidoreductase [Mycolicibacterium baixiangningiae]|uniref:nitroreductase family deazaflavin-dependent oxidoreductase n=1 Tax=Mycolicibacterium baixiangningiae TaxID=2761578 RepID=UPI0018D0E5D9|nr:nitroreductase family deazaflavin-dependent oxidoreductase [Mycolicibacterium baixiangningiae]